MKKVYNFSAGPAMLPHEVLLEAQKDLVDYKGSGLSVMEMSHRSSIYDNIHTECQQLLRELLDIPSNYKVLFLQGGATLQFSMVPINLMKNKKAAYVDTGIWAVKAANEAKKVGEVTFVASSKDKNYNYIPDFKGLEFDKDLDYVHITSNNTIFGTKITDLPDTGDIPLVTDMSSCILSEKINVSDYGIIYAGAQKNIGPSGLTVVIIREDLINENLNLEPVMLDYSVHSKNDSLYNTPPTFGIYMAGLVFKWLKNLGGVEAIEKINNQKANLLYDYLDESEFFEAVVKNKKDRSIMNVTFLTPSPELDAKFVKEAGEVGIINVKGHKLVGGLRASIYNPMTIENVQFLIDFMKNFEAENK